MPYRMMLKTRRRSNVGYTMKLAFLPTPFHALLCLLQKEAPLVSYYPSYTLPQDCFVMDQDPKRLKSLLKTRCRGDPYMRSTTPNFRQNDITANKRNFSFLEDLCLAWLIQTKSRKPGRCKMLSAAYDVSQMILISLICLRSIHKSIRLS